MNQQKFISTLRRTKNENCPICISKMDDGISKPILALPCGHCLHVGCISSFSDINYSCPTCRAPIDSKYSINNGAVFQHNIANVWTECIDWLITLSVALYAINMAYFEYCFAKMFYITIVYHTKIPRICFDNIFVDSIYIVLNILFIWSALDKSFSNDGFMGIYLRFSPFYRNITDLFLIVVVYVETKKYFNPQTDEFANGAIRSKINYRIYKCISMMTTPIMWIIVSIYALVLMIQKMMCKCFDTVNAIKDRLKVEHINKNQDGIIVLS